MPLEVREATSAADRALVYRLRYEVYVDEMCRDQVHADHEQRLIHEPFDDSGRVLLAEDGGVALGTIRLNFRKDGPLECEELYDLGSFVGYYPDRISMTTKLIVRRELRGSGLLSQLIAAGYVLARQHGMLIDVIDTNPHLVRLYQQLGYRYYRPNIEHPEYGNVIPMAIFGGDLSYLESIGSPFAALARQFPVDSRAPEAFRTSFPAYASIQPSRRMSDEALWARFAEHSGLQTARTTGFLKGFEPSEVTELLRHVEAFDCLPGAVVIRQGDQAQSLFGLLEGQAEVRVHQAGSDRVVDLIHAGEAFGEMAFVGSARRNASIVIREASKVLVLSRADFTKLAASRPSLALKLLMNLFELVVERFNMRIRLE